MKRIIEWLRDKFGKGKPWDKNDFVESVYSVMQKQEAENPKIKQLHARLSPEWGKATNLIASILQNTDQDKIRKDTEELALLGEVATRALIHTLLILKNGPQPKEGDADENNKTPGVDR